MSKTKGLSLQDSWKQYVLSPAEPLVRPKRVAIVPWRADELRPESIQWREPGDMEELPVAPNEALLLDFGVKTAGFLFLQSKTATDFGIDLQFGPDIRLVIFEDHVRYSSGAGCFTDTKFRAFRFLKMRSAAGAGISVCTQVQFTGYRGDYRGHFLCSDELLNRIWYTGAYTVQLCTQPHELSGTYNHLLPKQYGDFPANWRSPYGQYVIWDGPRRDREIWIGDMWPESHSLLYSFHFPDAIKSSLHVAAVRQFENGAIPGSGITLQNFAEYSCWWLVLVDRLFELTADRGFVMELEEHTVRCADWLLKELDSNGGYLHINHRQTWAWTLQRRGTVTGSQCVAVAALRGAARLLRMSGRMSEAEKCDVAGKKLADQVSRELWREDAGVFRDCLNPPDGVDRVSCDSNALASLFHVAGAEQSARSMRYLEENLWTPFGTRTIHPPEPEEGWNWAHNHNVWPFVVGLELEARFERGHTSSAMQLLRNCWGNMINKGANCFWEMVGGEDGDFVTHRRIADIQGPSWDTWDSYSHGWSAGPTYMTQAYILGIRPLEPGFSKFLINPRLSDLEFAEGTIPTPKGPISIRIERVSGGKNRIQIEVPDGLIGIFRTREETETQHGAGYHEWEAPTA